MVRNELVTNGIADTMIELTNRPVKCRCGAECIVKILDDQWFINYGDQKWKTLAHECVNKMDILPEEIRQEFNHVIDWLRKGPALESQVSEPDCHGIPIGLLKAFLIQ